MPQKNDYCERTGGTPALLSLTEDGEADKGLKHSAFGNAPCAWRRTGTRNPALTMHNEAMLGTGALKTDGRIELIVRIDAAACGLGTRFNTPENRLCARRSSVSAVSRPKPSSGPLAFRPVRLSAVTRPARHDTRTQPPEQTSPFQVAAPSQAGCVGQECT